jgi:tetratricopeptide (TPR) repeat protein
MVEAGEVNISKRARELFAKGLTAMERNNLVYAIEMFFAAVQLEPRFLSARNYLRAAEIKQFNDRGGGPVQHAMAFLTGLPQLVAANWYLLRKQGAQALQTAENLMRLDPLHPVFLRTLEKAAVAAGMPEVAIQSLTAAREYSPDDVDLIVRLGRLLADNNQLAEAKECMEKAASMLPNDARVINALKDIMARETMAKGGWTDASRSGGSFRDAIKDEREATILERGSRAVQDDKSLELLLQDMLEKVKQNPDNINFRRQLANLYVKGNRFNDAIRALEEARRGSVGDPQIDQALTQVRLKQFDYEIEQAKANGDTEGVAARTAARADFHFKDVKTRVERYPNDWALRFEFGELLLGAEQLNEAIQQFQLAQRNPQVRLRAMFNMALCFKQKGQLELAGEQLEKVAAELTDMNDFKKEVYYQMGEILEQQGKTQEAIQRFYKEIYQVDISYRDIAAKMEQQPAG